MNLLLIGGRVATMEPGVPAQEALWIKDNRIAGVGSLEELRFRAGRVDEIKLRNAAVLPGFHDTHTHFFELARKRAGVDLSDATSVDEVGAKLRAYRDRMPEKQDWVGGSGWDPGKYGRDPRLDIELLDSIFPDNPVALEARDFHTMWCNRAALERAGVYEGREAPAGGRIGRDGKRQPDGFLYETAWDLIWSVRPPETPEVASKWLHDAIGYAHSLGLTGFHSMEVQTTYDHYARLRDAGQLEARVCFHSPLANLQERIAQGLPSYRGEDPWLQYGGVKIFMDGSLGSRSAWMFQPYPDGSRGHCLLEPQVLRSTLLEAARAGIGGSVHAIGDATVHEVAEAFVWLEQQVGEIRARALRPRMEHAQCVRPKDVELLRRAGVYCAMQPVHLGDDIANLEAEWGTAAEHAYPLASLRKAGVRVGLGSDAPVASLDPRLGIFAAAARRARNSPSGSEFLPDERVELHEAIAGYTCDAAVGGGREDELGTLAPGKLADVVVFDDVLDEEPSAWLDAKVQLTIVDGRVVHENFA